MIDLLAVDRCALVGIVNSYAHEGVPRCWRTSKTLRPWFLKIKIRITSAGAVTLVVVICQQKAAAPQ
jgi:hypothetical protein